MFFQYLFKWDIQNLSGITISEKYARIFVTIISSNNYVKIFKLDGTLLHTISKENSNIFFEFPSAICVDDVNDQLFVVDRHTNCIHIFNLDGQYKRSIDYKSPFSNDEIMGRNPIESISCSYDGKKLFVLDKQFLIYDIESGNKIGKYDVHLGHSFVYNYITCEVFIRDLNRHIFVIDEDGEFKRTFKLMPNYQIMNPSRFICMNSQSNILFSHEDNQLKALRGSDGTLISSIPYTKTIVNMFYDFNSQCIYIGLLYNFIEVYSFKMD